jgi:hypothetical protein
MAITLNTNDNLFYMTAADFAADVKYKAIATCKVYVYETGKIYVSDGAAWHELGVAD